MEKSSIKCGDTQAKTFLCAWISVLSTCFIIRSDNKISKIELKLLKMKNIQQQLTLMTTSQKSRCFRIVLNDWRKFALSELSVNLRKPQSSIASSSWKENPKRNCWNVISNQISIENKQGYEQFGKKVVTFSLTFLFARLKPKHRKVQLDLPCWIQEKFIRYLIAIKKSKIEWVLWKS